MDKKYFQIWKKYESLEKEFDEILSWIPLEEGHLDVWSYRIGDSLLVTGSILDSVFKLCLMDKEFCQFSWIDRKTA